MTTTAFLSNKSADELPSEHMESLAMLDMAFAFGRIGLLRASRVSDGEEISLLCLVERDGEQLLIVPVAELVGADAKHCYQLSDNLLSNEQDIH